ncbi:MAG: DegT/DnrJ/EryC1/StrS family aminotransferase [Actinobacteria bacterium]|nr:DegT/DnrJ/EryC1/StrS family aminotransferase [Actinomycetota bacterium]
MNEQIPLFNTADQLAPLREKLHQASARVIDSGRFIFGPEVTGFEQEFADYVGAPYAVGVGNGTDALMLALRAVGVEPGDDVVVPSFTFYATAEAVAAIGARPVFCDVDPATFNVTAATVEAALTPNTTAVVAVHLFGLPAPVQRLRDLLAPRGIKLVEDAAQAAGARLDGVAAGALGDAATFSFFPSKNLGAFGDAGIVTTADVAVADKVRLLRHHGTTNKQSHTMIGYNSRLDAIQAAMLRVLLPELNGWNDARRAAAAAYEAAGIREFVTPQAVPEGAEPVYHLYVVSHDDADAAIAALAERGVEARGYYRTPVHVQPPMLRWAEGAELPGTARAAATNIALPVSPVITPEQVEAVVAALSAVAAVAT